MIYPYLTSISKKIYMHNRDIYVPCTSQKSVLNPIPVPAWYERKRTSPVSRTGLECSKVETNTDKS
jgi:hypothetical protein